MAKKISKSGTGSGPSVARGRRGVTHVAPDEISGGHCGGFQATTAHSAMEFKKQVEGTAPGLSRFVAGFGAGFKKPRA